MNKDDDPQMQARSLREATRELLLAYGALDEARRPCGTPLSTPHAYALIELLHQGPMSVAALASRLNIDRTNVSRLCMRMEREGELRREADPQDRRVRRLRLTERGELAARKVDAQSAAHFERVMGSLEQDSAEIIGALRTLAAAMRRQEAVKNDGDEDEEQ